MIELLHMADIVSIRQRCNVTTEVSEPNTRKPYYIGVAIMNIGGAIMDRVWEVISSECVRNFYGWSLLVIPLLYFSNSWRNGEQIQALSQFSPAILPSEAAQCLCIIEKYIDKVFCTYNKSWLFTREVQHLTFFHSSVIVQELLFCCGARQSRPPPVCLCRAGLITTDRTYDDCFIKLMVRRAVVIPQSPA